VSETPKMCAERAEKMLTGAYPSDRPGTNESPGTLVVDALTDIMHYCDANGIDFYFLMGQAEVHHDAEVNE